MNRKKSYKEKSNKVKSSSFWDKVKEEFVNGFAKVIGWTIPLTLATFIILTAKEKLIYPDLSVSKIKVTQISDKSVLSPENPSTYGHEIDLTNVNENGQIVSSNKDHEAPELEITLGGKGQINSALIFYRYNQRNKEGEELLKQNLNIESKSITGISITPKRINAQLNVLKKDDGLVLFYLVLQGETNSKKDIFLCAKEGEEVIVYSEADIDNVIMYGAKDGIISYQKEKIQKDIREIKNIL